MRKILLSAAVMTVLAISNANASEAGRALPDQKWSFEGFFGTYDKAQLQRGFTVYQEVCSACHSLRLVAYRSLTGIGLDEEVIKEIAGEKEVAGGPDDDGEPTTRPAIPADHFVPPFPNANAARSANNGALPPDLSLIVKARKGGTHYLYALLTGYEDEAPEDVKLSEGMNYNPYFPGGQIAMAPPLAEDAVEFSDGTKATVPQMAADVTAFLTWAASPELEERKRLGVKVILFMILLTGLLYAIKKKVWADVH